MDRVGMRTARWLVIATALAAAGAAFHLLTSPNGGTRAPGRGPEARSSGSFQGSDRSADGASGSAEGSASSDRSAGRGWGGSAATAERGAPSGGRPLDEIDAESREAMRSFLRESTKDGE